MKKLLALLLVCVMLLGVLAGCSPTPTPDPTPAPGPGENDDPNPGPDPGPTPGPTPTENVVFDADFAVAGSASDALRAALTAAGVTVSDTADKKIYAGTADAAVATTAAAKLNGRETNYNDYAIVCDGTSLSVAAGSDKAMGAALAYLTANYVHDGKLSVPEDLSYLYQAQLIDAKLLELPLTLFSVYYDAETQADLAGVASHLADLLSEIAGKQIPVTTDASKEGTVRFVVENKSATVKDNTVAAATYRLNATADTVTLTGATRGTVAFAASDFAALLAGGTQIYNGVASELNLTTKTIKASEVDKIKYCGTWEHTLAGDPDAMVCTWNTNYFEIDFEGQAVTLNLDTNQTSNFRIRIDKGEYSANFSVKGDATFYAGTPGKHTLRVEVYANRGANIYLKGITVEAHETITRTPNRAHYIQFVGDSISDAGTSFVHRVGNVLDWDFSVIALSGISLCTGRGYWSNNNPNMYNKIGIKVGMEDAFFRNYYPGDAMLNGDGSVKAGYENYVNGYFDEDSPVVNRYPGGYFPDIVYVFLGTNDALSGTSDRDFEAHYEDFVENILYTYGNDTQVCVMSGISYAPTNPQANDRGRQNCIDHAADYLMEKFPDNVLAVKSDVINTWDVEISSDNVHPVNAGYNALTDYISELLNTVDYYGPNPSVLGD